MQKMVLMVVLAGLVSVGCTLDRQRRAAVWMEHEFAALDWTAKHGTAENFDKALEQRIRVVERWRQMKAEEPSLSEESLDQLLAVSDKGFMREYVWTYLHRDGWRGPDNLDLERFDAWREDALDDHDPHPPTMDGE
ncbi:MAG: hypothetical protein HQL50_00515 [Magnetococcales bacterium]|nr:hypothetical protein [Magnetococcales bacterium]